MSDSQGQAAPRTFNLSWTEVRPPLLRAAATLWLPAALPFAFSPLAECGHCVGNYLRLLPVLPGVWSALWCQNSMTLFYAVAGTTTLLLLALVATLFGVAGRRWPWVAVPVAALAAAQAIGLGYALRM